MAVQACKIDSTLFETFLQSHGFTRTPDNNEIVYERPHKEEHKLFIKVYTSSGIDATSARDVGKDAIRVVAVLKTDSQTYGIFKGTRVHRVTSQESVHHRTLERIELAMDHCSRWLAKRKADAAQKQLTMQTSTGKHYGEIGDNVCLPLMVSDRKPWGDRFLFTFKHDEGYTFTYWSFRDVLVVGNKYMVRAKIRAHTNFRGLNQTDLANCGGKQI